MSNQNNKYAEKQLHYADRTFDIVPNTITPINFNLERGLFNQVSDTEFKQPEKYNHIKETMSSSYDYKNPYLISTKDFTNDYKTRKLDKRNKTDIYNERIMANSNYINQLQQNNNNYVDRFYQHDQKNPNHQKIKNIKTQNNMSFQEYLDFKRKMKLHDGTPKF